MRRVAEYPHKDVLGAGVIEERSRYDQTGQRKTKGDLFQQRPGAAERRRCHPGATPSVYDLGDGEVDGADDDVDDDNGLFVVLGLPHLGDDRQVSRAAGARDEYGRGGGHTRGERGVRDGVPPEVVVAGGRGGGGAIAQRDADGDGQHAGHDGDEAGRQRPRHLAPGANAGDGDDEHRGGDAKGHGAGAVVRERVETDRGPQDPGPRAEDVGHDEHDAHELLGDGAPKLAAHVDNCWRSGLDFVTITVVMILTVTFWMSVTELSHTYGRP